MVFKRLLKAEWFLLILFVFSAIFIRSLNNAGSLNFSSDQGKFSIKALEILRRENPGFSLIGPSTSLQLEGREIFQGGVIYYFQALFLFLGNLDPVKVSLFFMIFSCFMMIPLYFGIKFLTDKNKALFVAMIFCLLPVFVNYTKFLWNPNFQLSLLPLLFLLLGLYKKSENQLYLLAAGVWFGFIFQFHYQLFIGGLALLVYSKLYLKASIWGVMLFILGGLIGFAPILIFELRNNFYNLNTLLFYLQNFSKFQQANAASSPFANIHYLLSLMMLSLVMVLSLPLKISQKVTMVLAAALLVYDLFLYLPSPAQGFGMSKNWSYPDEAKAFEIIKNQDLENYNVTNLGYDTLAYVQKYLHKKDNMDPKLADYWEMDKLFVIAPKSKDIFNDPAYEIQVIKPFKIVKDWEINPSYNLYLVEKAQQLSN